MHSLPALLTLTSGALAVSALVASTALGRLAWRQQSDTLWWTAGGVLCVGVATGLFMLTLWTPGYALTLAALEVCAAGLFLLAAWRMACAERSGEVRDPDAAPDALRAANVVLDEAWVDRVVELASTKARPSWGTLMSQADVMVAAVDEDGALLRADGGLLPVKESARHVLGLGDVDSVVQRAAHVQRLKLGSGTLIIATGE